MSAVQCEHRYVLGLIRECKFSCLLETEGGSEERTLYAGVLCYGVHEVDFAVILGFVHASIVEEIVEIFLEEFHPLLH